MSEAYQSRIPMMANQIAAFFATQPEGEQVSGVANHINAFWEPRMRAQLFELIEAGGDGLHPLVVEAAAKVRKV